MDGEGGLWTTRIAMGLPLTPLEVLFDMIALAIIDPSEVPDDQTHICST